jgi:hypothetical protein
MWSASYPGHHLFLTKGPQRHWIRVRIIPKIHYKTLVKREIPVTLPQTSPVFKPVTHHYTGSTNIIHYITIVIIILHTAVYIPDDGGSTHLWNVSRQSIYTAVQPRRQLWTSYSPPWELEISHRYIVVTRSLSMYEQYKQTTQLTKLTTNIILMLYTCIICLLCFSGLYQIKTTV